MGRTAFDSKKYLQKQRAAILNNQVLSDREMALGLGVTRKMWGLYKAGIINMQDILLYNASMGDPDIAVFARAVKKEIWGL